MQILVTGAAGFIGSHLTERLAACGHDVTGVDAFTGYYDRSLKEANATALRRRGVTMHRLNLAVDPLAEALHGIEAIYHLAAQPGLSAETAPATFVRNNVRATERLLDAVAHHPHLRAFIHASSSSVYGADATGSESTDPAPISVYGRTKWQAERLVRAAQARANWEASILRLFSVYGPRERPDKLIHKAIRCAGQRTPFPLYAGSEQHRRSFTYVGDIVTGMVAALDRWDRCAGETINLGHPTSASTLHVLQTVADVMDVPLCIRRETARAGDQRRTEATIDKARRLLDFDPRTSLRTGIEAEVAWMRGRRVSSVASGGAP